MYYIKLRLSVYKKNVTIINNFRQPELKILVFVVSDLIEDLGTYFVTVFRKKFK
jgi:hypothetical protein